MDGINCREARLTDQSYIDDLSKGMYQGTDYTPKAFPKWIAEENWRPYVAETSSGNVVGFVALQITANGSGVVVRSARVAESYRGKGIYTLLLDYALLSIKQEIDSIKTVIQQRRIQVKTPSGYNENLIFRQIVVRLHCNVDLAQHTEFREVENLFKQESDVSESAVSQEMFSSLFENHTWVRELFPHNLINIGQEIYYADDVECRKAIDMQTNFIINYTENGDGAILSIIDLGSYENVSGYQFFTLDLYGNDTSAIKYHTLKALKMVSKQVNGIFDLAIQMHSKEAEDVLTCFQHLENCEILKDIRLKAMIADIDLHPYRYKLSDIKEDGKST